jgi:hypothetical protein
MVPLLFAASGSMRNSTPLRSGFVTGPPVLLSLGSVGLFPSSVRPQFFLYPRCPPLVRCLFADCESVSADTLDEKAQHHLMSGLVLRLLASFREKYGCATRLSVVLRLGGVGRSCVIRASQFGAPRLVQFRVLRFCCNEDGNVRVGILPEREEILIGRLGFGGVALDGIGSADLEMR